MEMEREEEAEKQALVLDHTELARSVVGGHVRLHETLHLASDSIASSDIQDQADRFRTFSARGRALPCLNLAGDHVIPIDATEVFGNNKRMWEHAAEQLGDHVAQITGLSVAMTPTDVARQSFTTRIAKALHVRFGNTPPSVGYAPGLEVKVTTRSSGARLLYSPATLFVHKQVFGAPTSPVTRPIQPGIYLFGIERPDTTSAWDSEEYEIPPLYDVDLSL